jgi:hypothetical protein
MSTEDAKPAEPPDKPAPTGEPEKKLTFFERLIQKTAKLFRQSR